MSHGTGSRKIKKHHDSGLMRMLLADLRERRVDLKEFCQRVKMLIGAPALVVIVMGLRVTQSLKKAQLVQEREHQLASPVGSGSRPLRAPAGGPTPPSTTSTTAADASPAAAPPAAALPAAAPPGAAGGYVDHAEVHSLSSLKRKVEVLQQANQRLDAENAVIIKQKLAGKRVLHDSESAYATQRMLFKRMVLKRVLLERYDRA